MWVRDGSVQHAPWVLGEEREKRRCMNRVRARPQEPGAFSDQLMKGPLARRQAEGAAWWVQCQSPDLQGWGEGE